MTEQREGSSAQPPNNKKKLVSIICGLHVSIRRNRCWQPATNVENTYNRIFCILCMTTMLVYCPQRQETKLGPHSKQF